MSIDYPIRTERLLLRPFQRETDVRAVHAYQSDPEVCRFLPYEPRSEEEVIRSLADPERIRTQLEAEGQAINLAITHGDTQVLVGEIILVWQSADDAQGEIGYVINSKLQGNGFATEACRAILDVAFGQLDLHRVFARIDQRNAASIAVGRRLGMRQEAMLVENEYFKGQWTTEVYLAILASEWTFGERATGA